MSKTEGDCYLYYTKASFRPVGENPVRAVQMAQDVTREVMGGEGRWPTAHGDLHRCPEVPGRQRASSGSSGRGPFERRAAPRIRGKGAPLRNVRGGHGRWLRVRVGCKAVTAACQVMPPPWG